MIGVPDEMTASCFITADTKNNTVMGFYAGAMARSDLTSFHHLDAPAIKVALIGPTVPEAIERFPKECRALGIPFVYMPALADDGDGWPGARGRPDRARPSSSAATTSSRR